MNNELLRKKEFIDKCAHWGFDVSETTVSKYEQKVWNYNLNEHPFVLSLHKDFCHKTGVSKIVETIDTLLENSKENISVVVKFNSPIKEYQWDIYNACLGDKCYVIYDFYKEGWKFGGWNRFDGKNIEEWNKYVVESQYEEDTYSVFHPERKDFAKDMRMFFEKHGIRLFSKESYSSSVLRIVLRVWDVNVLRASMPLYEIVEKIKPVCIPVDYIIVVSFDRVVEDEVLTELFAQRDKIGGSTKLLFSFCPEQIKCNDIDEYRKDPCSEATIRFLCKNGYYIEINRKDINCFNSKCLFAQREYVKRCNNPELAAFFYRILVLNSKKRYNDKFFLVREIEEELRKIDDELRKQKVDFYISEFLDKHSKEMDVFKYVELYKNFCYFFREKRLNVNNNLKDIQIKMSEIYNNLIEPLVTDNPSKTIYGTHLNRNGLSKHISFLVGNHILKSEKQFYHMMTEGTCVLPETEHNAYIKPFIESGASSIVPLEKFCEVVSKYKTIGRLEGNFVTSNDADDELLNKVKTFSDIAIYKGFDEVSCGNCTYVVRCSYSPALFSLMLSKNLIRYPDITMEGASLFQMPGGTYNPNNPECTQPEFVVPQIKLDDETINEIIQSVCKGKKHRLQNLTVIKKDGEELSLRGKDIYLDIEFIHLGIVHYILRVAHSKMPTIIKKLGVKDKCEDICNFALKH